MSQMIQKQTRTLPSRDRFILSVLLLTLSLWPLPKIVQAQWVDNGSNLTTDDNVGIGTPAPGTRLDIIDSGNTTLDVITARRGVDNEGEYTGILFGSTVTNFSGALRYIIGAAGAARVGLYVGDNAGNVLAERMSILSNGNVGIGTMEPDAGLHVYGNGNRSYGVLGLNSTSVGGDGTIAFLGPYAYLNSDSAGASYWSWGHRYDGDANAWVRRYPGLPLVQAMLDTGGNFKILTDTSTTSSPPSFTDRFIVTNAGDVGIGTTTPRGTLDVNGRNSYIGTIPVALGHASSGYPGIGYNFDAQENGDWKYKFTDTAYMIGLGQSHRIDFNYAPLGTGGNLITWNTAMSIKNDGNIGIGTTTPDSGSKLTVNGNVTVTGNIAAKYQDVAEWVTSPKAMPAGTVVMLHPDRTNQVLPSMKAYDTRVAGVVSDMPGLLLGEAGDGKVKVATTGRVKVKVDATKGPVQVGDLLVTSDKEGIAMKSEPLDLGGVPIHRPGTLIGKALEPLSEGEGEILVLLSLQ